MYSVNAVLEFSGLSPASFDVASRVGCSGVWVWLWAKAEDRAGPMPGKTVSSTMAMKNAIAMGGHSVYDRS
jgi:hypothetical protein